jgi:hypothetical protein
VRESDPQRPPPARTALALNWDSPGNADHITAVAILARRTAAQDWAAENVRRHKNPLNAEGEGFQNAGSTRTAQRLFCPHWQYRSEMAPFMSSRAREYQIVLGFATD